MEVHYKYGEIHLRPRNNAPRCHDWRDPNVSPNTFDDNVRWQSKNCKHKWVDEGASINTVNRKSQIGR